MPAAAEGGVGTREETFWWQWLGRGQANLRAALDHCLGTGDLATALPIAAALGWYWYTRGYLGEGQTALDDVLSAAELEVDPPRERLAGAQLAAGILAWSRGDLERAEVLLARCLDTSEGTGDLRRTAIACAFLGHVARDHGDFDAATGLHRRARGLHERQQNPRGVAWAGYDLGVLAAERGDLAEAAALLRSSLRAFADMDYAWAVAYASWALGGVELRRSSPDEAARLLVDALDRYWEVEDRRGIAQCFELLAEVAAGRSAYDTAARLLGAAAGLRTALAAPVSPAAGGALQRVDNTASGALGAHAAERARRSGRTMALAAAVELARKVGGVVLTLTLREREVAALVASGSSNRQIGRTLGIAERTAEVHVRNTMAKLGARSRSEVAAWAVSHDLHQPS